MFQQAWRSHIFYHLLFSLLALWGRVRFGTFVVCFFLSDGVFGSGKAWWWEAHGASGRTCWTGTGFCGATLGGISTIPFDLFVLHCMLR